jgi:RNA polymerase sigma-70 factor (ECF subfamily)
MGSVELAGAPGRAPADEPGRVASEGERRVHRALDQLPADRRAILVLHYGHAVPIEGLARVLDIPAGTVKSRLFHARRELGRLLGRDEQ